MKSKDTKKKECAGKRRQEKHNGQSTLRPYYNTGTWTKNLGLNEDQWKEEE